MVECAKNLEGQGTVSKGEEVFIRNGHGRSKFWIAYPWLTSD